MVGKDNHKKEERLESRDRYEERNHRPIGSGYWTNEPGFQEARLRAEDGRQRKERSYMDQERADTQSRQENKETPRDSFENDEYYANRGWSRSAAVETERDWAFQNNQDFSREGRLEINYYNRTTSDLVRKEREFGEGMEAMRNKAMKEEGE